MTLPSPISQKRSYPSESTPWTIASRLRMNVSLEKCPSGRYPSSSVRNCRIPSRDTSSPGIRSRTDDAVSIMHTHLLPACSPLQT